MSDAVSREPDDLLVVYGTLRSGTGWRERLGVAELVEPLGRCRLSGSIFEIDWYPGLILDGAGAVVGDVLRLLDPTALAVFDRFEGYDPARPEAGPYRRVAVDVVIDPAEDADASDGTGATGSPGTALRAWVYEIRALPPGSARVIGGDWLLHTQGDEGGHG